MLLRNHPLMRYRGVPSWPPNWVWTDGFEDKRPKGEVGVFRRVSPIFNRATDGFFLSTISGLRSGPLVISTEWTHSAPPHMNAEELEKRMDELAREFAKTHVALPLPYKIVNFCPSCNRRTRALGFP